MSAPLRRVACLLLMIAFAATARAGTMVRFTTTAGAFDVALHDEAMPITVANFLAYFQAGSYTSSVIHRSTTYDTTGIQVVQGGGFTLTGNQLLEIPTNKPIVLESGTSGNVRGTIAMARGTATDSATSQFYFNVQNNPGLDGNYAVFGTVVGTAGLAVLDALAAIPVYDAQSQLGGGFGELPLTSPSLAPSSLVLVNSVAAVPEPSALILAGLGLAAAVAFTRRPVAQVSNLRPT
jgi:peptidyl-prolyl cis-trans isomerase A (cyclophilin A)